MLNFIEGQNFYCTVIDLVSCIIDVVNAQYKQGNALRVNMCLAINKSQFS